MLQELNILNRSEIPPFTIEEETDGGEEFRMKYRYLDLRRSSVKNNIILRHRFAQEVRKYMDSIGFIEVETPVLIKSTPEGARDFVVPSRMQPGTFYALPQSPQTLKQLLMVAGFDKYFQIVKCFRDEDLVLTDNLNFPRSIAKCHLWTGKIFWILSKGWQSTCSEKLKGLSLLNHLKGFHTMKQWNSMVLISLIFVLR